MNKDNHIFSVSQLSEYIKSVVSNKKICVNGEVSQPKLSGGHLYFSIKDESTNIKAIIWKSKNINKELLSEGSKVTLDCKLDFYGGTSSVNLIVDKIVTNEGQGELFIKYEQIKNDFMKKGYFDQSHKKQLPDILKKILIITSENGAALQDFIYNLEKNHSNIDYDILDVCVQGVDCPKNICDNLRKLKKSHMSYDLVVITRGGGSFADLFGFSQPELIESVYNFHLPVLSAIGHQVDNPLLDLVADISTPTPSLASQFIVDHNKKYINELKEIRDKIKNQLYQDLNNEYKLFVKLNEQLMKSFNTLTTLRNSCKHVLEKDINNLLIKLSILESKLTTNYSSIVLLDKNQQIEKDNLDNYINKIIQLRWGEREYKIKIIN